MKRTASKSIYFLRFLHNFFAITGLFFSLCIVLAFTEQPYWAYHWLGTSKARLEQKPEVIILLGGAGMPAQDNLMRSWYTGKAARSFPDAQILIAMPGNIKDSTSTPRKMQAELQLRGIKPERIAFEAEGTNTRSQALGCRQLLNPETPILLVTSPEHMRRAVLCFEKAGFSQVNGLPAFENAAEADFRVNDAQLGGDSALVPDLSKRMNMRYQVWNHLKYEIIIARECCALAYYKLRGWI